ncbi:MAG: NAD(P)/FAD-dependent oxidoreductase [Pseudomonadota bacterium]
MKFLGLLSMPFNSNAADSQQAQDDQSAGDQELDVIIVGCGAAGMAAAHLLRQKGVNFQILEANSRYGGRLKDSYELGGFPISLGGEWLHDDPGELDLIINDADIDTTELTRPYSADARGMHFQGGRSTPYAVNKYLDRKFVNSSWLGFFEQYILPGIETEIRYNVEIERVDYSGDGVRLTDSNGNLYRANCVIVTVPLRILQTGKIEFSPNLPAQKQRAIDKAKVWGGIKVFTQFSEAFYPTAVTFSDSDTADGQRLYYDAAYAQDVDVNVLGLFAVGRQAERYQSATKKKLESLVLGELDEVFDGAASRTYIKQVHQNWSEAQFAGGAYLHDYSALWIPKALSKSVNKKLYFAGTSYSRQNDWSSVHTATHSARRVVREIVG